MSFEFSVQKYIKAMRKVFSSQVCDIVRIRKQRFKSVLASLWVITVRMRPSVHSHFVASFALEHRLKFERPLNWVNVREPRERVVTSEIRRNRSFCDRSIQGPVKKRDWPKPNRSVLFCSASPGAKFWLDPWIGTIGFLDSPKFCKFYFPWLGGGSFRNG